MGLNPSSSRLSNRKSYSFSYRASRQRRPVFDLSLNSLESHTMTRSIWNRVVARLFDKKSQVREQSRRKRLGLEWLEVRLAPATDIWTGLGGANTAWSNAANWSRANIQQVPQAGDDLLFDGRTTNRTTNNDLAAGFSINLITIDASNYTLGGATPAGLGNRITLGAAGIHVNGGKTNEKVALDLQLGTANIATTFSFTVDSGADLTVSGHISGFANVTLAKKGTGNGILTLTNDNTVVNAALNTGLDSKIDIQTGILAITNSKALGNPGTVVAPGASFTTVEVNAQLQIAASGLSIAEALHLNGVGIATDGAILETVGTSTWTGAIQ